jgi:hypothetical protein
MATTVGHARHAPITLSVGGKSMVAAACGITGIVGMAVPVVIYDWAKSGHSALELPMAVTGWIFGLQHFVQNGYLWWPIVVGAVLLVGYGIVSGIVFGGIADRILALRTYPETLAAGLAFGFASWLLFWYTLLPIAKGGAPFHATLASTYMVAPAWVFIVGFAVLGLVTATVYRLMVRE